MKPIVIEIRVDSNTSNWFIHKILRTFWSRNHPFGKYTKFSEKLLFLTPLNTHTNMCVPGGKKGKFFEIFCVQAACMIPYKPFWKWNDFRASWVKLHSTTQKIKFSIKNFFSKDDQIHSLLQLWSHLLKKSSIEKIIFGVVLYSIKFSMFWQSLITGMFKKMWSFSFCKNQRLVVHSILTHFSGKDTKTILLNIHGVWYHGLLYNIRLCWYAFSVIFNFSSQIHLPFILF